MDFVQSTYLDPLSNILYSYVLIYLLLGVGLYFTVRTRGVQFRYFTRMVRQLGSSRAGAEGGISSFQAFCVGLASRVGTGNIAGVSIALTLGGAGAIFWMWVVAALGMASAFVEATLAQIFKVKNEDGSFRGGPAYYIQRGLGSRAGGIVFAVLLVFTFGIAFNMVQANTVADVLKNAHTVDTRWTALVLMLLAAPVLFGGIKRIAKIAEVVLPVMALVYVLIALVVIVANIGRVPEVIIQIVGEAFGLRETTAGAAGGVAAALLNGLKRGLFSNEAGMGSAPNTAATATVSHPVKQGLVQSLGVFVDTMVVCTATAMIVLMSGVSLDTTGGAALTQSAVAQELGSWTTWLMTILVFVFAFSSVLGNYSYAEVNMSYLGASTQVINVFRIVVLASVGLGSILALTAVWAFADVAMALMALVNLVAIVLLSKWAFGALRDYARQSAEGVDPVFSTTDNPDLPPEFDDSVWTTAGKPV